MVLNVDREDISSGVNRLNTNNFSLVPMCRIIQNIPANGNQFMFVADNMFVIVALPTEIVIFVFSTFMCNRSLI